MKPPVSAWFALAFFLAAAGFLARCDLLRVRRIEFVTQVAADGRSIDSRSPTGWAGGKRWLIIPEHDNRTYQLVQETQTMLSQGVLRLRTVPYENAPAGRELHTASLGRWWLAAAGWIGHAAKAAPLPICVEEGALTAAPLLHALILLSAVIFAARVFGAWSAAFLAGGLVALYPLASAFQPGIYNDEVWLLASEFWSLLLVGAGLRRPEASRTLFFAAGIAGGVGLWVSVTATLPVIVSIGLGGIAGAAVARWREGGTGDLSLDTSYRWWGLGGFVACMAAYLLEFFPDHLGWQLRVNHPLYGIAWLGFAELVAQASAAIMSRRRALDRGEAGMEAAVMPALLFRIAAGLAVAALAVAWLRVRDHAFLAADPLATRIAELPGSAAAPSLRAWIRTDGFTAALAAALLPALVLIPAGWAAFGPRSSSRERAAAAGLIVPAALALALAGHHLRDWSAFDTAALALAAASCARGVRWAYAGMLAASVGLGAAQLWPSPAAGARNFAFTRAEVEGLYERALAHWIADRVGTEGGTVLTPPLRTSSFCFYGNLRGLGTPDWDNRDGLAATYRIASSLRPDETEALLNKYSVTHIVLPSWDRDLDEIARLGVMDPATSFIYALRRTYGGIFPFLRPMPYAVPNVPGFGDSSVLIFAVGPAVNPAILRSRLVEDLIEMHRLEEAAYAARGLLKYPADLGSLVARAQLADARGDEPAFASLVQTIASNLRFGGDRRLPFDRRASLAVVLELGGQESLSGQQTARCVSLTSAERIRDLTTGSLFHLMVLMRHFGLKFASPALDAEARELLPTELRPRV